ncbi:OB-fold-containig protein [Paracoccus sp. SSJ]|uniref:OB-fold-containig protein n=1 Tax=Paracoccus sp. SSJ TaxID=3050636 RepID=UPI002550EA2D|nr:OB-fold-containig protein [Paracoccus sp. SSJ]MDK8871064.1 DUF1449 family protein [Paracoccus sp. SSJ]
MPDHLLSTAYVPFSLAFGLLVALLLLEIVALLVGGSLLAGEADGPDIDTDLSATFDLEADAAPDMGELVAASDRMIAAEPQTAAPQGLATWLGLGHTPLTIWLAALLLAFGLSGFLMQTLAESLIAHPLPAWIAVPVASLIGIAFAARFAQAFARLLPQIETSATSAQFMGGLRGVVSQGNARHGSPAEVRLRDLHGNIHHLRCEPLLPDEVIAEGTRVLTVRQRVPGSKSWTLRIIAIE